MGCSNNTCIDAAGTAVATSLADFREQYNYMIKTHEIPPGVTTTMSYEKYLAYVSANLLALQAVTRGVICEATGTCACIKQKFFYAQYIGAKDGAFVPAITVCTQKLN